MRLLLSPSARSRRLAAGQLRRAPRRSCRSQNALNALAVARGRRARRRPARRPLVELLASARGGRRAGDRRPRAERRRAGRCRRPGRACRSSSRTVVPWKPMSPTQCWAQACGQPSRFRRSAVDAVAEPLLELLRSARRAASSSRRPRSCSAARRCRRSPSPRSAVRVERRSRARRARRRPPPPRPRDVRDHEVLLPREPHLAAERLGQLGERDELLAGDQAEVDREADVAQPVLLLRLTPRWSPARRARRQREVVEAA